MGEAKKKEVPWRAKKVPWVPLNIPRDPREQFVFEKNLILALYI